MKIMSAEGAILAKKPLVPHLRCSSLSMILSRPDGRACSLPAHSGLDWISLQLLTVVAIHWRLFEAPAGFFTASQRAQSQIGLLSLSVSSAVKGHLGQDADLS